MMRQLKHPQPSLFDKGDPHVALAPAPKVALARLVEVLLLEIAVALANREIGNDQDHL
jgi:hypothetical protein